MDKRMNLRWLECLIISLHTKHRMFTWYLILVRYYSPNHWHFN